MTMRTLLQSIDLAGKIVLPFVTYAISGMSGMSGVDTEFLEALPEGGVRDGLAVRGKDADGVAADVEAWLRANALT